MLEGGYTGGDMHFWGMAEFRHSRNADTFAGDLTHGYLGPRDAPDRSNRGSGLTTS